MRLDGKNVTPENPRLQDGIEEEEQKNRNLFSKFYRDDMKAREKGKILKLKTDQEFES